VDHLGHLSGLEGFSAARFAPEGIGFDLPWFK
jgi:hypothetical protein